MVSIELDKPRTLKYSLAALRDLEAAMGGASLGQITVLLAQVSITATVTALWAGLKHEDASLTQKKTMEIVEQWLDEGGSLPVLAKAIDDAMSQSTALRAATSGEG